MICRGCLKQRRKETMRPIMLPGNIGLYLPYVIDLCPECRREFYRRQAKDIKTLLEDIDNSKE